jgi:hypothetical protein
MNFFFKTTIILGIVICTIQKSSGQVYLQGKNGIIKTNVFILPEFQQWALTFETKTKSKYISNSFTIGHNYINQNADNDINKYDKNEFRKATYFMYQPKFHLPSISEREHFFLSPYIKYLNRKVFEKVDPVTASSFYNYRGRDFDANSIAIGFNMGIEARLGKSFILEFIAGTGVGRVISQDFKNEGYALKGHLDGQMNVNVGFVF